MRLRDGVLQAVRAFFATRGYVEVETPAIVSAPGQESNLDLFRTRFVAGRDSRDLFLITSPEHHMKRLLGAGCGRIYQVCRSFRNGERSPHHSPEFTMLEWYRAWTGYEDLMLEVAELVAHVAVRVRRTTRLAYQGRPLELRPPWRRLTVAEAFARFCGVDLLAHQDARSLCARLRQAGFASVRPDDTYEDAFHKGLIEGVEPALADLGAVILHDYPAPLAALARMSEADPRVAQRAEAYLAGVEIGNGFAELGDPREQRRRFAAERQKLLRAGRPVPPLDRDFLAMLEAGMPPAVGMALGIDRLAMVLADAPSVDQVMAFPMSVPGGDDG
ncbi:MAG: EF-P lysine aminoacylase EpmA [Candidatus Latescibacterota bacterium]